jgi:sugar O-acyltransferase (sialic acid O-acetyltransferase NeuD family)
MKKIAVYGAGGFGREVDFLIRQINAASRIYEFIGYFDDGIEKGRTINDFPILGNMDDLNKWKEPLDLVIAVGETGTKKKILNHINNPFIHFPVLIHPGVLMGDLRYNSIGEGSVICAGNIITVNVEIGKHVIMNLSCTVGHDARIGDYCSIMPSVNISGEVVIGESVFIGTGAQVNNQVTVGENSIIGSGAVVAKDLPPNCTAVGIPAKPIKFHS